MLDVFNFFFGKHLHLICVDCRSLIKLNCSSTRTKIMLQPNTKHFFMLLNAPLYRVCFPLLLRNHPNNQSSLQQVPDLRLVFFLVGNNLFVLLNACGFEISSYVLQQQLQALLETLSASEPHYIRCVKPNNLLKPAIFENKNVLLQLRCGVRLLAFSRFMTVQLLL